MCGCALWAETLLILSVQDSPLAHITPFTTQRLKEASGTPSLICHLLFLRAAWHLCPPLPTPCGSAAVEFSGSQGKQVNVPSRLPTVVGYLLRSMGMLHHSLPKLKGVWKSQQAGEFWKSF